MLLKVKVYDDQFYDLVDMSKSITLLGNLGGFAEGLTWSEKDQDLTLNSLTNKKTWRWSEKTGFTLLRQNTNMGNGMAYDTEGRLIVCVQIGFSIASLNRDMTEYQIIASEYNGKPFNSPNDVVVHSNGKIYFTDPIFGRRPTRHGNFGRRQQLCQGVYCIDPKTYEVTLATDEQYTPNGLCFSPDETKIYFAESYMSQISVMDVLEDGTLCNKKNFAHTVNSGPGMPDGIKVDACGDVWCAAEGGIQVFDPNGKALGLICTPEVCGNFCFGGSNMEDLFFGSEFEVYRLPIKVKGQHLRK